MKKNLLGFDIGSTQIKIVERAGDGFRVHRAQTPENLIVDGQIKMPHLMTDFLKTQKKELKLRGGPCAVTLSNDLVVCRSISLPAMTESRLALNLPFEFSDYISDEPQKYVYDYALQEMICGEDGEPREMALMGAAMSKEQANRYHTIFRQAGFKLSTVIPQEMALTNIFRNAIAAGLIDAEKEYCLVDLTHRGTTVCFFRGARLQVLRSIQMGGADIDRAIAEQENVDSFVARTYKSSNFNEVLEREYCRELFTRLAVEVMKVANFYRFNNRESEIDDIFFAGGGGNIGFLCETIASSCGMNGRSASELLPPGCVDEDGAAEAILAIGSLLQ